MKCPICDGGGRITSLPSGMPVKCTRCNGTGEVEMTNEDWFCSLSTEEKATFLAIQIRLGVEFYRTNDERYQNHDWWVEWLKQPHTEKE